MWLVNYSIKCRDSRSRSTVAQVNIKLAHGERVLLDDKSTNKSKSNKQWSLTAGELHEVWKISSEMKD